MNKLKKRISLMSRVILFYNLFRHKNYEVEMHFLNILCDKRKISIDIGARRGKYSFIMEKYSKVVYAFDPNPDVAILFKSHYPKVIFSNDAISNKNGVANYRIAIDDPSISTIEKDNFLNEYHGSIENKIIGTRTLDSYGYDNIGTIKIDVEGHELSVLQGSDILLDKYSPILIIEIEERHKPNNLCSIIDLLESKGYRGFFIYKNKFNEISDFQVRTHQSIEHNKITPNLKSYINNFIFVHKSSELYQKFYF